MPRPQDKWIPLYVEYLRSRASLAAAPEDSGYESLELAAHLFAVAQQLVEDDHKLLRVKRKGQGFTALSELPPALSEISPDIAAQPLYDLLLDGLSLLESIQIPSSIEGLSGQEEAMTIDISEVELGDERKLGGRVTCWPRRRRLLRELCSSSFDAPRKRGENLPAKLGERPDKHLERLSCYWRRSNRPPRVQKAEPEDHHAPFLIRAGLDLEEGEPFRLALCPLGRRAHPVFEITQGHGFHACLESPLFEPKGHTLTTQLSEILETCQREEIHLLVLPELSIDGATRAWLGETLRSRRLPFPQALVAGSFHVERTDSSRPYNECHVLDHKGGKLMAHDKHGYFRILRDRLSDLEKRRWLRISEPLTALQEKLPNDIPEEIEPGTRIEILDTALGQIAILICADAIDTEKRPRMQRAVEQLRPDLLLIPSMSDETDLFETFAETMERLGVATFFVNARSICPEAQTLAAVSLYLYQGQNDPPIRVRWRHKRGLDQWLRRTKRGDLGPWQSFDPAGTPLSWLSGANGHRLGLVTDLGAYWRPRRGLQLVK